MLKVRHFTISLKISSHFEFDGRNMSQKKKTLEYGQHNAGKISGIEEKHLEEHLTTNYINWQKELHLQTVKQF